MIFMIFVLTFLFASLHAHSADVAYCIDFTQGNERFLFVERYNDPSPISLSMQDTLECVTPCYDAVGIVGDGISFNLGDTYFSVFRSSGGGGGRVRRAPIHKLPSVIQANYPLQMPINPVTDEFKKTLLSFENEIIDAILSVLVNCPPYLDSRYEIDIRVKIVGECKSNFLEIDEDTKIINDYSIIKTDEER